MTEQPTIPQPPSLRHLFPFTGAPKHVMPSHVIPLLELLVSFLRRQWPATFTVVHDGVNALTIRVEVNALELPAADTTAE